ncbi:MAG: hypothetical protein M9924_16015 [Rhizobiaceae bacterium]|nr:hypothetical protein [Rhizobiaceae bacterium]
MSIYQALRRPAALLGAVALCLATANFASAGPARDQKFFDRIEGQWTGPGEVIAGKYKGTKFVCTLAGASPRPTPGMSLDGSCRVGVFSQKISAAVERKGRGYAGTFLDGSKGKGIDVIGGNVVNSDKIVLSLNRSQLNGAMIARLSGDDGMVVTITVRVGEKMIPVLGMNLKRVDNIAVGAIASE